MRVLVTGTGGYVDARLIPRLLGAGHQVRAAFETIDQAEPMPWRDRVEAIEMDVFDADRVDAAVDGVDAVCYLIHGLGGEDFREKDAQAAHIVARAGQDPDLGRIVYLSGIVPHVSGDEQSEHITSRHEVEQVFTASGILTITLRAAILLGSGSTSFEIVRQVSERLPVQTVPTWMRSQVQPIAVLDAIEALLGAAQVSSGSRSYDIGGTEAMSYDRLLQEYAEIAGLRRPQVTVPFLPADLVGGLVARFTDVPTPTVRSLVESLRHDMVCSEEDFRRDLLPPGYTLVGVREAITRSLRRTPDGESWVAADPLGPMPWDPSWAGGRVELDPNVAVDEP